MNFRRQCLENAPLRNDASVQPTRYRQLAGHDGAPIGINLHRPTDTSRQHAASNWRGKTAPSTAIRRSQCGGRSGKTPQTGEYTYTKGELSSGALAPSNQPPEPPCSPRANHACDIRMPRARRLKNPILGTEPVQPALTSHAVSDLSARHYVGHHHRTQHRIDCHAMPHGDTAETSGEY